MTTAPQYPSGARILVRDAEWMVLSTEPSVDGTMIKVAGVSEIVRDQTATFFTELEADIEVLNAEDTRLVEDASSCFLKSRLFLESVIRRTPLPQSERRLALPDRFLLDPLGYQQRPAELALRGLRPRILLADVVGLGKTLEIGLILAELIRRGRGDRILVVTPQHVLEQFQQELWTRFAIPLVRLDSIGIARIQREIPADRNPFTYFKRVIVSIDTLNSVGRYGHHLEQRPWDVVVIDESHNLMGETSLRNRLARVLAKKADALLLASATPHNGDKRSFAELIKLLDPAAIADVDDYTAKDIEHLYLRRTKISPEVRDQIGLSWADRGPSLNVPCPATEKEELVFQELAGTWLPAGGPAGQANRLFPFTLLKSFLSSHVALAETIANRLGPDDKPKELEPAERTALKRLKQLTAEVTDADSAKLKALLDELRALKVGPRSDVRVVIFSERVPTLKWLAKVVPPLLKLEPENVSLMHGGIPDQQQQTIIDQFKLEKSPVRLLFTGDVASEGVNLHKQCHLMIHYDLPWSLIRIEQRNGRIDRYGQKKQPEFRALILTSQTEKDDRLVGAKLLEREAAAHASLGTAEAVTGLYSAKKEEDRLIRDLIAGKTTEQSLADAPPVDVLGDLMGMIGTQPDHELPERADVPALFATDEGFVRQALLEVFGDPGRALGLYEEEGLLQFDAPPDLARRLNALPSSYLAERRVDGRLRLRLTFDRAEGQARMTKAVEGGKTTWPDIDYVTSLHPVVDWLVDKVLVKQGRQQAPVILAAVDRPVYLVQGVYSNGLGRPTVVRWMAVDPQEGAVRQMTDVLKEAGVGPEMSNPRLPLDIAPLQEKVRDVIAIAREHLREGKADWDHQVEAPLKQYRERLETWESQQKLFDVHVSQKKKQEKQVRDTVEDLQERIRRLETTGDPLFRLLAVLAPGGAV